MSETLMDQVRESDDDLSRSEQGVALDALEAELAESPP